MKAIIDMTVAKLFQSPQCQDLPENTFEETTRKLKEIFDNREGVLYSKNQAKRLMELTGCKCGESIPLACDTRVI